MQKVQEENKDDKGIYKEELKTASDFVWKLCQTPETASYPIYNEKEQLKANLQKRFYNNDSRILGYYKDDKLIAVIDFFFIENEKYLQSTGVYIEDDYNKVMDAFMKLRTI